MPGSMLIVVSYVLLALFLVVFLVRSLRIMRMPVHLRWELAPVPHEKGKAHYGGSYLEEPEWWSKPREKSHANELAYMFLEIAFLKALWEHNRRLWWFSFPFHFGLYLLTAMAGLLVLGGIASLAGVPGPGLGLLTGGVPVLAALGYVLGAVGAVGLFFSRLLDARLRVIATPVTYLNLVLLVAFFGSGGYAVLSLASFPTGALTVVGALLTADTSVQVQPALATHVVLAGVFLAYLPFTQMMHFVAKYFTYHQVRWDDAPLEAGSRTEKEVEKLLGQTVTWGGPHLGADGKKTWADIATSGIPEEVES